VAGEVWDTVKDAPAAPWGNMDAVEIVQRVLGEALHRLHISEKSTLQEAADAYLRLRSLGAKPYDDVMSCLNRQSPGYELGIVTNGLAAMQQPKIEAAGLAGYFRVTTTTDIGFGKPGPEIFMHALDALGVPADAAVYVGDSLTWDVRGAGNAGVVSVWLNRNGSERTSDDPLPDAQIVSLAELPELVPRL
jgi:putative hydrolase of the HAD superfamily